MARREMTQADAAELILREFRRPLHRDEITTEIIKRELPVWGAGGPRKTPWESVGRAITQEIATRGDEARFDYVGGKGSGRFTLRDPQAPNPDRAGARSEARREALEAAAHFGEATVSEVIDSVSQERILRLGAAPLPFAREAIAKALREAELRELEEQHQRGYELLPVQPDEFSDLDPAAWDEL